MERYNSIVTVSEEKIYCAEIMEYENGREKKVKVQISFTNGLDFFDIARADDVLNKAVGAVKEELEKLKANADDCNNQRADCSKGTEKRKKKGR